MNESPLIEAQHQFVDALPVATTASERCELTSLLGYTLREDVIAPTDMPPYHRAIVEGFVVNTSETADAAENTPVNFAIKGAVKPGDTQCPAIAEGAALSVSTGSIMPDGPISIVRQWEAQVSGDSFHITRPFPPRFFIEEQGCDLKKGEAALTAGTIISPKEIEIIASLGINEVNVAARPRVAIFASGDEVIPYNEPLAPGAIRDSNSIMLASAISQAGGIPVICGIMRDDFDSFCATVRTALDNNDMIVIAGGTAIGGRDFISDLVTEVGDLILDGVPMRSGKPLIMGIANNKPIICVAGHPPEALRGFTLFGVPAINKLMGNGAELPIDDVQPQP